MALGWWLDPSFGPRALVGLALGTLIGGLCQLGVQLPTLFRQGFRLRFDWDTRDAGVRRCGVHLITPETETSTHYYFAAVRNYLLGDQQTDEESRAWQHRVFNEQDRPMLEAVQEMMGTADFASLHPALVPADQPGMRIRTTMRRLQEKEAPLRHPERPPSS